MESAGFGRAGERWLDALTISEARQHLAAGEFPSGSMGPKIEAAIEFVCHGGQECIITSTAQVAAAAEGKAGTHIVAS